MRPRQTSHKPKKRHKNRILWLSTTMVVLFVLSIFGLKSSIPTALAMEQATRCGLEEHVHDDDCYIDNVIICQQKAHSHSSNCYLLLLEDNDINMLLTAVSQTEDKNLESLIAGVLGEAVRLNDMAEEEGLVDIPEPEVPLALSADASGNAVMAASFRGTTYAGTEVSQLNNIIDTFALEPAMVLNEGMAVPMAIEEETTEDNSGIMTAAVQPSANTSRANIYIYLDGEWQCIDNTRSFSTSGINNKTRYISAENLTSYVNAKIDSDFSTNLSKNNWKYKVASGSTLSSAGFSNDNITFGSYNRYSGTQGPIHLYLYNTNGTEMEFYTVTVIDIDGNSASYIYSSGTTIDLDSDYHWEKTVDGVTTTVSGTPSVDDTTTFRAKPKEFDVSIYVNGVKDDAKSLTDQKTAVSINLGTLYPNSNYIWFDGDGNRITNLNQTVSQTTSFYAYTAYTVTYYMNGELSSTETVRSGETITLPSGYEWHKNSPSGEDVSSNLTQTITANTSFYGYKNFSISYDVNFPGNFNNATPPPISGENVMEKTYTYTLGDAVVIKDVTARLVKNQSTSFPYLSRVLFFTGWKISGTDTILTPNTTLTQAELNAYAGSDGQITLVGVWDTDQIQTVSFYLNRNSEALDFGGNTGGQSTSSFSGEIFATYLGGADGLSNSELKAKELTDDTPDNSYTVDQEIRSMVGQRDEGLWLYSFPSDQLVFDKVIDEITNDRKTYKVDGVTLTADEINANNFDVRWYVFKLQSEWHVDGRLVRKVGKIDVEKTFAGNSSLLADNSLKEDFYIVATNEDDSRNIVLYLAEYPLSDTVKGVLSQRYSNIDYLASIDDGDGNRNTYQWQIEDVKHGEKWSLNECSREELMKSLGAIEYTEHYVVDASGNNAGFSNEGKIINNLTGVTQATDLPGEIEWLTAGFNNIYYPTDTLMLKKEDKQTGNALSGATFQLYQRQSDGAESLMHFEYDSSSGLYRFVEKPTGNTVSDLVFDGYLNLNIQIKNFAYQKGDIIVKETVSPEGYHLVDPIVIGRLNADSDTVGIKNEDVSGYYTEYYDGLLVIQNSSDPISVTVNKDWLNCTDADKVPVVIRLLANNSEQQASLLGAVTQVTLNRANNFSHTWNDLPVFADGVEVNWTVQEIKIGDEELQNGTFVNWSNPIYYPASYDEDGNITFTVVNTMKRCMLNLFKTDWSGNTPLENAVFQLIEVDRYGNPASGAIAKTATTNSNGYLAFENLKYATRYMLTEVTAPEGYWTYTEPAYLTINSDGTVTVENDHEYVSAGSYSQVVQVKNRSAMPMPDTGGGGTLWFTFGGMLLLLSVFTYLKNNKRKKRRRGARRTSR